MWEYWGRNRGEKGGGRRERKTRNRELTNLLGPKTGSQKKKKQTPAWREQN
jgi:hypothetical protein